ncbi:unnamed protein product [Ectocarpus sp. 13 AM-2016]
MPRGKRTGFNGSVWIDCNGYYAYGGDVEIGRDHHRNLARAFEDEGVPSTEPHTEPLAKQDSVAIGLLVHDTIEEDGEGRADFFVRTTDDDCDAIWTSWPAVQETAIARGTVLVFDVFPSIGNLFITLHRIIKTARLLEVALALRWRRFHGFRAAFDPASIKWDQDLTTLFQRAQQSTQGAEFERLYPFSFLDGQMVLSHWQLQILARKTGIPDTSLAEKAAAIGEGFSNTTLRSLSRDIVQSSRLPLQPCVWNMFLRRSAAMMASLEAHNPWTSHGFGPRPKDYVAWHIRTSDGESKMSFLPDVHRYIFHGQSSTTVFPIFQSATDAAKNMCPRVFHEDVPMTPVYISSNSKSMSRNCTALAAEHGIGSGFVDLGIDDVDAHTDFSRNPEATALNAFIDYLYLMDASIVVQTGSSFSSTVASIKGFICRTKGNPEEMPVLDLKICMPADC